MANPQQVEMLLKGAFVWNRFRREQADSQNFQPDLSNANLGRATLLGANLSRARMIGVDLTDANLRQADLRETDLRSANLGGADLTAAALNKADLSGAAAVAAIFSGAHLAAATLAEADLSRTDMTQTILTRANLSRASLTQADLSFANIGYTVFGSNDLSTVRGLASISHHGPSTIGIDTIYASKGEIPERFLRGCGLPDNFITYVTSLVGKPVEFYSCFISYSTANQEFADRLHADLQAQGVRCWFAPHDMAAGKKVHEQIDEAIRLHERLLLILSPASMVSEWVRSEIAKARKREVRERRRVLFPVRLTDFEVLRDWECFDADTGKDSASEIREYFIPDFSGWKDHDVYRKAFNDLLRDLKAEGQKV
jgi:hypothetical protein